MPRPAVRIEVALKKQSTMRLDLVKKYVVTFVLETCVGMYAGMTIDDLRCLNSAVRSDVVRICVTEITGADDEIVRVEAVKLAVHVYTLKSERSMLFAAGEDAQEGRGQVLAQVTAMPAVETDGLWESLRFTDGLKDNLQRLVESIMVFSDVNVDEQIISCNRLILFHGSPGSGKTSLCRALAHKCATRFSGSFARCLLVEANACNLFSRWFSESSKLMDQLFDKVLELSADTETLVCVMLDEVESISGDRADARRVGEPGRTNVLVLATSNFLAASDGAFIDRADLVQYIGHPDEAGVYAILRSTVVEAVRRGLVVARADGDRDAEVFVDCLELAQVVGMTDPEDDGARLARLARACVGGGKHGECHGFRSGRALRKLLLVSHARCSQSHRSRHGGTASTALDLSQVIDAMWEVVTTSNTS